MSYDAIKGLLQILIAPFWLFLIWRSLHSGMAWGWGNKAPTRHRRPIVFWLCICLYLVLAIGFAWQGIARL